ncbi:MAG: phage major capsid protein [Bacteroidales bacterium]|nr:phage major capsid protein [Bacteroidales bacterium]
MNDSVTELRDLNLEKESLMARKAAIKKQLQEHRDTLTDEQIASSTTEATELRDAIRSVEEKIKAAQERVSAENEKNQNRSIKNNMENVNIRQAFAKYILRESTHRPDVVLNDAELRALGVATTTTSETFVAPSSVADGINNGGIFIHQEVMLDILREEVLESPIYRDIVTTAIKGKVKFPYRVSKSGAKVKAELSPTENESVKWDILNGATGNYTDSIVITFEEEAMAIAEFTDYLISLISESMRELLINDYIYGIGSADHVKGITIGAISAEYASTVTDLREALEAGIKALPVKKRAGAKIYVASDIFDSITFSKDKNGNYILPVLNGGGLTRMSTFPVEADPNLAAGDFIIGNVGKWYKANINKGMELGVDISNKKRIKEYTAHMMVTAAPVPSSFVYGKKKTGS